MAIKFGVVGQDFVGGMVAELGSQAVYPTVAGWLPPQDPKSMFNLGAALAEGFRAGFRSLYAAWM